MSQDKKMLYVFAILLVVALLGALFLPGNYGRAITALFLAVFAVAVFFFIKKRTVLSINKNTVFLIMLAMGAVCLVLYYLTGVHFGFYKSSTPLSMGNFFKTILPIAGIIVATEFIRCVLLAQNAKLIGVFAYIAGVLSELLVFTTLDSLTTFSRFMDAVGFYLLPAITANFLYNFLAREYGMLPGSAYRLLMTLYPYVLPVYPKTPDAIFSFTKIVIPIFAYYFISKLYAKGKVYQKPISKFREWVTAGLFAVIMVSIVLLISGAFRYRLVIIATPSMTGTINEGDAVVYEEYGGQIIPKDTVVVFTKNGRDLIVHRVIDIKQMDETIYYVTKGDANEDPDVGFITAENIHGVVLFKVSYLGYPSLWLRELFS